MHSRSVLLLDEELKDLQANPLWGVALQRVPRHPLVCFGSISGNILRSIFKLLLLFTV